MASLIKAEDLTNTAFLEIISALELPEADRSLARLWAVAPGGWVFDYWRGPEAKVAWYAAGRERSLQVARDVLKESVEGRLFAPSGELRWRVIPALSACPVRTVFLGEDDWLPGQLGESQPLESLEGVALRSHRKQQEARLLWGTIWRDKQQAAPKNPPPEWIELQIPHRLAYPLASVAERLRLDVEIWTDERGEPHFVRFCDLQEATE